MLGLNLLLISIYNDNLSFHEQSAVNCFQHSCDREINYRKSVKSIVDASRSR